MYDVVIQNGKVIDGTGRPAYEADIGIQNGKIAKIAPVISTQAKRTVDAQGKVVAPGFVDFHSHADGYALFGTPGYEKLEQGITTEITGHCGDSIVPGYDGFLDSLQGAVPQAELQRVENICRTPDSFIDAVSAMRFGTNMAYFIGHGSIRARVMGYAAQRPDAAQLAQMKDFVRSAMENGFVGLSSGLIYPPSVYADTEELKELAAVAAEYDGRYTSHIRGEGDSVVGAVREAIEIGESTGCTVIISHLKVYGKQNVGKSKEICRMIEQANRRGKKKVYADQYPFIAGCTSLVSALPPAFATDGIPALIEKLHDEQWRQKITRAIERGEDGGHLLSYCGFDGCMVLTASESPQAVGKSIAQLAGQAGKSCYDTMYDLITANNGNVLMAYFGQNNEDMLHILSMPFIMGGTDTGHNVEVFGAETAGGAHPRGMSTFPRHIRLVREKALFTPEQTVHKLTAMAAEAAGIDGIGRLLEGYNADLVVFDWDTIGETNDFLHPYRKNMGVDYVIVNGEVAVENGSYNGARAGKLLTKRRL